MKVKKYNNIEEGKIYSSNNYGDFIIVKKESYNKVLIRFIETEFEKYYRTDEILYGSVKDPYRPNICGVGYIGEGIYKSSYNRVHSKEYVLWTSIIHRCYNSNTDYYYLYGGNGVTVDKRWHDFQNFCEDIQHLKNYDKWNNKENKFDWTIDKDKYSKDGKIYSKDTCWFTNMSEQNLLHNNKKIFGYVNGVKFYEFNNIKDISEKLCIEQSSISASLNKYIHRKSAGSINGFPIIWRYEDDLEDIIYKRKYTYKKSNKNYYNGFVEKMLIFKRLTSKEIKDLKITKSIGGLITSIKKKGSCGKYNNKPIFWEYEEEGNVL